MRVSVLVAQNGDREYMQCIALHTYTHTRSRAAVTSRISSRLEGRYEGRREARCRLHFKESEEGRRRAKEGETREEGHGGRRVI